MVALTHRATALRKPRKLLSRKRAPTPRLLLPPHSQQRHRHRSVIAFDGTRSRPDEHPDDCFHVVAARVDANMRIARIEISRRRR
jgi:hypothetical protein